MVIIFMGVSGSGKTTVGKALAHKLGCGFHDADDLHPPENIRKMSMGLSLDDADRLPWLEKVSGLIEDSVKEGRNAVVACSALKKSYRDILLAHREEVRFVYLKGSLALVRERAEKREGHFMNAALVESQFAELEEPEDAVIADISMPPDALASSIMIGLGIR